MTADLRERMLAEWLATPRRSRRVKLLARKHGAALTTTWKMLRRAGLTTSIPLKKRAAA